MFLGPSSPPKMSDQEEKISVTEEFNSAMVKFEPFDENPTMNSVKRILDFKHTNKLSDVNKFEFKSLGPPRPPLQIKRVEKFKTKEMYRHFNKNMYNLAPWLCGCDEKQAMFCYVCLIIDCGEADKAWVKTGVTDIKHLSDKVRKHSFCAKHINNSVEYNLLGSVNIRSQLDTAYRQSIIQHNNNVRKNRYILHKLIDCIRFCGAFEFALRGQDESESSLNPGVFKGLVNLLAEVDNSLKQHLDKSNETVFSGLSETTQNELLDSIYEVCLNIIKKEIKEAEFLAIEVDDTTDNSTRSQLVLIMRYQIKGIVFERFITFLYPIVHSTEAIAEAILIELTNLGIDKTPNKLIAQCYDGALVMSGQNTGVQVHIKDVYPKANFIHCYVHQLNLIMERAASQNKQVRIFFMNLDGFAAFFSRSAKRTGFLDEVVKRRLPRGSTSKWDDFHSRTVNTVYTFKDDIVKCLQNIQESDDVDCSTYRKALGLLNICKDDDFNYWLYFFNKLMSNSEILLNNSQLKQRQADTVNIKNFVQAFKCSIQKIRENIDFDFYKPPSDETEETATKRVRFVNSNNVVAKEVCDVILRSVEDRFSFDKHLTASLLFDTKLFSKHRYVFPQEQFEEATRTYNLKPNALKHELTVIYSREDFQVASGALTLLQFFYNNNLDNVFPQSVKLLSIIVTIPMVTSENERCLNTFKRVKTFSRNTMKQDRLSALAMCSIEKKLIQDTDGFNELVIDHFANQKQRHADFVFKSLN